MFDFPFEEPNVITATYVWLLYIIILLSNLKFIKNPSILPSPERRKFFIILIGFALITFCTQGDFFTLMRVVRKFIFSKHAFNYTEDIYVRIGEFVGRNYFIFRLVVWGGSYLLFCITAKNLKTNIYQAVIILYLTHGLVFGYGRVTSAMAIYFTGLSFICCTLERYSIIKFVIGISLIILCLQFHTSAYILVGLTVLAIIPLNKYSIIAIIIILPLLVFQLKGLFEDIVFSQIDNERLIHKVTTYNEIGDRALGIAELMLNTIEYLSFYLPYVLITLRAFKNKNYFRIPYSLLSFYKVSLGLVFSSIVFMLFGSGYSVFIYRVLFMTMIPLAILTSKFYSLKILNKKEFKWCVLPGIIFMIFRLSYGIYCEQIS